MRWRLTDVIGAEDGLGVECLSGSGAIASAYCKAFREVRCCPSPVPSHLTGPPAQQPAVMSRCALSCRCPVSHDSVLMELTNQASCTVAKG